MTKIPTATCTEELSSVEDTDIKSVHSISQSTGLSRRRRHSKGEVRLRQLPGRRRHLLVCLHAAFHNRRTCTFCARDRGIKGVPRPHFFNLFHPSFLTPTLNCPSQNLIQATRTQPPTSHPSNETPTSAQWPSLSTPVTSQTRLTCPRPKGTYNEASKAIDSATAAAHSTVDEAASKA